MQELTPSNIAERLHLLTEVSVALGENHDIEAFLERILRVAKSMTNADGGTLYRPSPDGQSLCFHISLNDSLELHQGGASGGSLAFQAGQFGFVPSVNQPSAIVPQNPGLQLAPPPSFSGDDVGARGRRGGAGTTGATNAANVKKPVGLPAHRLFV